MRAKPFAFTREQLNGICVDPKSVPVARAVFASAATPIYFAPLVMHTFAGQCGYQPPDSVSADAVGEEDVYRRERAERLLSFLDSEELSLPASGRRRAGRQPRRARHPR